MEKSAEKGAVSKKKVLSIGSAPAPKKAVSRKVPDVPVPSILLEREEAPRERGLSGRGERYALGPSAPETREANLRVLESLPETYGTLRILLTARDPHWVYVAWDLSSEQQRHYNSLAQGGHLVVRVFENAISGAPHSEVAVQPESRSWFVHVRHAGTQYLAELGFYAKSGEWHPISSSPPARTPPEGPSEDLTVQLATLPAEPMAPKPERPQAKSSESPSQERNFAEPPSAEVSELKSLSATQPAEAMPDISELELSAEDDLDKAPEISQPAQERPSEEQTPQPGAELSTPQTGREPPRFPGDEKTTPPAPQKAIPVVPAPPSGATIARAQPPRPSVAMATQEIREIMRYHLANDLFSPRPISPVPSSPVPPGIVEFGFGLGPFFGAPAVPASPTGPFGAVLEGLFSPGPTPPGVPAQEKGKGKGKGFWFNINAELIIYGATEPDAQVRIHGRTIRLRPDGTFSFRFAFPDGNFHMPVEAVSGDGTEKRGAALRFQRQTGFQGEVAPHPQDPALKPPKTNGL